MPRLTTLTRRRLFEGFSAAGLAAITGGLPFLSKLPSALAEGRAPTRFLLIGLDESWGQPSYWGLGLASGSALPKKLPPSVFASGHPTDRYMLQPLEPYVDHLTLVGGLKGHWGGGGTKLGQHSAGRTYMTGAALEQYGDGGYEFHALGP